MDGGGGRKAANFVFSQARADGLNVGNVGGGVVANAILGEQGVQYDLDKMPFIGSPYSATHYMFVTRRDVGLRNLEKLRGYSGLRIGAQSVGHTNYTLGRIFAAILGLKDTKYVTGYSIPERDVALMRGEIDAITNSDDFYARNPEWVQKALVDFHIVMFTRTRNLTASQSVASAAALSQTLCLAKRACCTTSTSSFIWGHRTAPIIGCSSPGGKPI